MVLPLVVNLVKSMQTFSRTVTRFSPIKTEEYLCESPFQSVPNLTLAITFAFKSVKGENKSNHVTSIPIKLTVMKEHRSDCCQCLISNNCVVCIRTQHSLLGLVVAPAFAMSWGET